MAWPAIHFGSRPMKTKQRMRLEIKEITAEGTFEGILSPYGNVDSGGDVVVKGAYDKTLKEQGNTRPLLWQHKTDVPIGQLMLEDRVDGLWAKGQLLMALDEAQKAYLLIKAGIVKGLSIGFVSVRDSIEKGIRQLREIKLYEGSLVTFPMNEMALITSVKRNGETKDDFNEELSDIQMMDAGFQMRCALWCALDSMIWSGFTKEEIVSGSEMVIQQFTDAYMAYLPAFIDMLVSDGYLMAGATPMEMMSAKARLETKAGRQISAANMDKLNTAREHMKSAHDIVSALVDEEAGKSATPKGAGGQPTLEPKAAEHGASEPVTDHSWGETFTKAVRDLHGVN